MVLVVAACEGQGAMADEETGALLPGAVPSPAAAGGGGGGGGGVADLSEQEEALRQALIGSPAVLMNPAIGPQRLHELYMSALAHQQAREPGGEQRRDAEDGKSLLSAVYWNNLDEVRELLDAGADPNALEEGGKPLALARYRVSATAQTVSRHAPLIFVLRRLKGHGEIADELKKAHGEIAGAAEDTEAKRAFLSKAQDAALRRGRALICCLPFGSTKHYFAHKKTAHVQIVCSSPEYSLAHWTEQGRSEDPYHKVMASVKYLCNAEAKVTFGYDWAGSSTAEPADSDPERRVRDCCHALTCTCEKKGNWIVGPVDWSNPKSVAGSAW